MPAHRKCNHNGPRFLSNGACKQCQIARRKARRRANPGVVNKYNQERRAKNPDRENGYTKKYRKGGVFVAWYIRNRPYMLWKRAKLRAEKSGRDFSVTIEDITKLLAASTKCPYTGVPYNADRGRNPWAASIDRVDSSKGYVLDNLEITSLWWNLAKNGWSAEVTATALHGLRAHKT